MILGACTYNVHFTDCAVRCTTDVGCPEGLSCEAEGFCRTPSAAGTCTAVLETPPSCAGRPQLCGPSSDEDCCSTAAPISGGTFFRGYDVASDGMYPSTSYPATVSPFTLDRFEVTVGRFRAFVEAGIGTRANPPPAGAGSRVLNGSLEQGGWDPSWNAILAADTNALFAAIKCDASFQSWTDIPNANEELPINCVTWYEAFAFCAWDGGFLPTESEWNYVATGGDEQRAYPWSTPASSLTIGCAYANYNNGGYCVNSPNGAVNRVGSTSPKGDGKYGQADLAGNVFEWTLDWFTSLNSVCDDCANLSETSLRVLRGGGWDNLLTDVRTNYRLDRVPSLRHRAVGVRCAKYIHPTTASTSAW